MKSKRNGNGNGHHTVGTTERGAGTKRGEPFESEFITFEPEGEESFAAETSRSDKRRKNKRVTGAILLLLFVASVAIALYFLLGANRTPVNLNVRDTRAQSDTSQAARQSPEDVTSQAIGEVRSATAETALPVPLVRATNTNDRPTAPVTIPVDGLGATVTTPSITGVTGEQRTTDSAATSTTGSTERADRTSAFTSSRRNPERSIRCAVPVVPAVDKSARSPQHQVEHATHVSSKPEESGVILPAFGSMLPVRILGSLYALRPGSLARFELTRDVRGQGWSMRKGTILVGANRGSEYDCAYVVIVGFIDPESGRLVKLTGDVLGADGSAGLRGRRRSISSSWSRVLGRIGGSAVNVAGLMLGGLGRNSVVISDAYGYRVVNPVSSELGGLISERTNQQQRGFVEVPAGAQGYVMITDLPAEIKGVDALTGLTAKELADRLDEGRTCASTGLSERELSELLSSGWEEEIRAALPRMTPEMRRIAEAVIAESRN